MKEWGDRLPAKRPISSTITTVATNATNVMNSHGAGNGGSPRPCAREVIADEEGLSSEKGRSARRAHRTALLTLPDSVVLSPRVRRGSNTSGSACGERDCECSTQPGAREGASAPAAEGEWQSGDDAAPRSWKPVATPSGVRVPASEGGSSCGGSCAGGGGGGGGSRGVIGGVTIASGGKPEGARNTEGCGVTARTSDGAKAERERTCTLWPSRRATSVVGAARRKTTPSLLPMEDGDDAAAVARVEEGPSENHADTKVRRPPGVVDSVAMRSSAGREWAGARCDMFNRNRGLCLIA